MNEDYAALKRDYESCQMPTVHNPKTIAVLGRIAEAIYAGEISRADFDGFVDRELGDGYFNRDCKAFMDWVVEYLACRHL